MAEGVAGKSGGEIEDGMRKRKPEHIVQLLCDAEPTWTPGRRLAYHAITGGFILAEVVRRDGERYRKILREAGVEPQ